MFQCLPIELQHDIYDRLDLKSRIMLNIAINKPYKIQRSLVNNPSKDKQLRWLHYLVGRMNYTKAAHLPHKWQELVQQQPNDVTIQLLFDDIPDVLGGDHMLYTHIVQSAVSPTMHYHPTPRDPDSVYWSECIAKHASPQAFEALKSNPSTSTCIIDPIVTDEYVLQHFFTTMLTHQNRNLVQHILDKYLLSSWVQDGIAFVKSVSASIINLGEVKMVCELFPNVTSDAKQEMLATALRHAHLDTVEYLAFEQHVHV